MEATIGNCPNFTSAETKLLDTVNIVGSSVSFAASFATIALVLLTKSYRVFVHRLTAYLAIPVCLLSFAFLVHVGAVHVDGDRVTYESSLCTAAGFLVQYLTWVETAVACWINVYVLELAIFSIQLNKRKHEVVGVVLSVCFPLLLSWEPFVENFYGPAGAWCWIKVGGDNCTSDSGLGYQIGLYYAPLVLLSALNVAEVLGIAAKLCVGASKTEGSLQRYHVTAIKEVIPIFIYPGIFFLSFLFGLVHRISSALLVSEGKPQNMNMWVIFVLVLSVKGLYLPVAFMFHPHIWSGLVSRHKKTVRSAMQPVAIYSRNDGSATVGVTQTLPSSGAQTEYVVAPPSECAGSPLIIKSSKPWANSP